MIDTFFKNIFPWFMGFCLVAFIGGAIVYHVRNYINNRKHPEHESRVVQLKNGKFQKKITFAIGRKLSLS